MKKLELNRRADLSYQSALKIDNLFEFIRSSISKDGVFKKDTIELKFSQSEKLELFRFFRPLPPESNGSRLTSLNESVGDQRYPGPFGIMNLLLKHRK